MAVYVIASAMCEFFADFALCPLPLEATRIRLVSKPTFGNDLLGGFARTAKEGELGIRWLLRWLLSYSLQADSLQHGQGEFGGNRPGPPWFTVGSLFFDPPFVSALLQFATMKVILEIALKFTNNKKADLSGGEATVYKLGSGLIAGFATARHYHLAARRHSKALPGDTVTSRLVKMSGESGVRGLFTGLSTRLIMVG
ncbi:unnamed protein product [Tilletia controversa]|nr:unnamed protein product [Tilletia controversa]